jgi:hypothetical protein
MPHRPPALPAQEVYKLSKSRFAALPSVPEPSNRGFSSGFVNTYFIKDVKAATRAQ